MGTSQGCTVAVQLGRDAGFRCRRHDMGTREALWEGPTTGGLFAL